MKEKRYQDFVFCNQCGKMMKPFIVTEHSFVSEEQIVEDKIEYFEDGSEREYEDVTGKREFYHYSQLLRCSTDNCNRMYLYYSVVLDGIRIYYEIVPFYQSWQLKPKFKDKRGIIPEVPFRLYLETVKAFNASLLFSCGMLVGAILEAICIEEKIKDALYHKEVSKINTRKKQLLKEIEELKKKVIQIMKFIKKKVN